MAIAMNTEIPILEESCAGMKSATMPASESTMTVIITTIMRIRSFALSNLETRENLVDKFFSWFFVKLF
jgi:hypothetical protein